MPTFISNSNLAAILGASTASTNSWWNHALYPPRTNEQGKQGFYMEDLHDIDDIQAMVNNNWEEEQDVQPARQYNSIELFAGAGGLALGMSLAGFHHVLLNEFDESACKTLRANHPDWNVLEGDVRNVDFTPLRDKVDFLSGGFPCQAFSYAGKQGGFNDTRGTLFFELARAVKEIRPKVFMGENVKGLVSHEDGRTFEVICNTIRELGYTLVEPRVLKAIMYQVPQKRERIILIAIRNDIAEHVQFHWPSPYSRVMTLQDAFYQSVIFDTDVPASEGVQYPEKKRAVLAQVPEGGDWRDLPEDVAREYMGGSWGLGGGKTGMARRLSLDEPSLTLTCSPCQKQTERCHPLETRPLSVREYARIQTFPDYWQFKGSMAAQYKQIGNAVPVNLAWAVGRSLIRLFNDIQAWQPEQTADCEEAIQEILINHQQRLHPGEMELDFSKLLEQYPDVIVKNEPVRVAACRVSQPSMPVFTTKVKAPVVTDLDGLDLSKNLLVSFVKNDNVERYLDGSANIYYTGKRFPSTVHLNHLYYFMPYIKGKGVRDLYLIKVARVGTRREGYPDNDPNDFRLVFEVEFVKQLFDDYKPIELEIWHTYTDTTLGGILNIE